MTASVEPSEFHLVDFDAGRIAALAEELAAAIGLDADVRVVVNEKSALGHTELVSTEPVVIETESGAFEDPKRIRQFSEQLASEVLGRQLLRAHDRRRPEFGEPPPDDELPLAHRVAWEVFTVGRLARKGYRSNRQRWLYSFRNRHGFTDAADAAFERLWGADDITWAELTALSDETAAQNPGQLDRRAG